MFEDMTPLQIASETVSILEKNPGITNLGKETLSALHKKLEFIQSSIQSLLRERKVLYKDMQKLKNQQKR